MTIGQKTLNNPRLDMQIAKAQNKLGDKAAAKATLNQILINQPSFEPAQNLLESLSL
jgi:hypothetical protein